MMLSSYSDIATTIASMIRHASAANSHNIIAYTDTFTRCIATLPSVPVRHCRRRLQIRLPEVARTQYATANYAVTLTRLRLERR